MIDAYAGEAKCVDHIAPIWRALPDELRGSFQVVGHYAIVRARELGIATAPLRRLGTNAEAPMTIVAGFHDEQFVRPRPTVLVEHGAGQSYSDHHPGHPGGKQRESVCLFLCPNERVARRWNDMYPDTPAEIVGCPKLDPWHAVTSKGFKAAYPAEGALPLVAFSFHWPCTRIPECRSAFEHFRQELYWLAQMSDAERGWQMAGHYHPKQTGPQDVQAFWQLAGIPVFERFEQVLDLADVYVCDNSSTIFEFASTDRPVVLLNAPEYRRDVEHGLRFWEFADVGLQVDDPGDLVGAIDWTVEHPDAGMVRRAEVTAEVYTYADGEATTRAVAAIVREYDLGHWRAWRENRVSFDPKGAPAPSARLDGPRRAVVRALRAQGRPLSEAMAADLYRASAADLDRLVAELRA